MQQKTRKGMELMVLLALCLVGGSVAQGEEKRMPGHPGHIIMTPVDIKWVDAPSSLPPGAKFAVIEGDTKNTGPFTMRFKFPADYKLQPHWHPAIEHVTVISGTLYFGPGDQVDPANAKALTAGSFAVMPQGQTMFGWTTKEETIIQVHGIGPWGITYVNPADDPRKK